MQFLDVCPEVGIGLPVPRPPIDVVRKGKTYVVIEEGTERDLTDEIRSFCIKTLKGLPGVDGFLLKSRSPTCGYRDTKIYAHPNKKGFLKMGMGIFTREISKRFPLLPIEDEQCLSNPYQRHHYFIRIFIPFSVRKIEKTGAYHELEFLHHSLRPLIFVYSPSSLEKMDALIREIRSPHPDFPMIIKNYLSLLSLSLRNIPHTSFYLYSLKKFYKGLLERTRCLNSLPMEISEREIMNILTLLANTTPKKGPYPSLIHPYPLGLIMEN